MKIGGLQKLTLIDFPEKPACTVFLAGCNLRCPWCHSPELVVPEKINNAPEIDPDYFFEFLKERRDFLDGVVICGGEPTVNEDLFDFAKKIKDIGYALKLDTNGTDPKTIKRLLDADLLDYVAMDVKAPLEKYKEVTGTDVKSSVLRESIAIIKEMDDYEFRTTVVPEVHTKRDILTIVKEIAPAKRYYLQNFRGKKVVDDRFLDKDSYPIEFLEEIKSEIESNFEICKIR